MEDKTSINDRIQSIINEIYNGNVSKFCREVGVKQPTMNTILGERKSKPSYDILHAISNAIALKSISIEWLIAGRGSMLKSESSIHEPKPSDNNLVVIEELKSEIIALKAENKVLRELAGLGERKDNKSA